MRHLHLSGLTRQANLIASGVADAWRPAAHPRSIWSNGLGCWRNRTIGKVEKAPEANTRLVVIGEACFPLARILQHLFALGPR